MSIYVKNKKLIELLDQTNLKYKIPKIRNSIVATLLENNKEKKIMIDEYNEENLKKTVLSKKYEKVIVDHNFWNYNYCKADNLDNNNLKLYTKNLKTKLIDIENFPAGYITMIICIYDIFCNIFIIKEKEELLTYLSNLNIDKTYVAKYLIDNDFRLPLTENYLELIKRIFTSDNIFDFLFKDKPIFDHNETRVILENFEIGNLNDTSFYIFTSDISDLSKLEYTNVFFRFISGCN